MYITYQESNGIRWLQHFPDYEVIVELDSLKSMHAYNWLEEKGYVECL